MKIIENNLQNEIVESNKILQDALTFGIEHKGSVTVSTEINCDARGIWFARALFSLSFKCKNCGKCCDSHFFPRTPLIEDDLKTLIDNHIDSKFIMSVGEYIYYLYYKENIFCLKQPCAFLVNNSCSIYSFRPQVCRGFPLNLHNDKIELNISCPGGNVIYSEIMEKGKDDPISECFTIE